MTYTMQRRLSASALLVQLGASLAQHEQRVDQLGRVREPARVPSNATNETPGQSRVSMATRGSERAREITRTESIDARLRSCWRSGRSDRHLQSVMVTTTGTLWFSKRTSKQEILEILEIEGEYARALSLDVRRTVVEEIRYDIEVLGRLMQGRRGGMQRRPVVLIASVDGGTSADEQRDDVDGAEVGGDVQRALAVGVGLAAGRGIVRLDEPSDEFEVP